MDTGTGLLHVVHGSIVDGQSSSVDPNGRRRSRCDLLAIDRGTVGQRHRRATGNVPRSARTGVPVAYEGVVESQCPSILEVHQHTVVAVERLQVADLATALGDEHLTAVLDGDSRLLVSRVVDNHPGPVEVQLAPVKNQVGRQRQQLHRVEVVAVGQAGVGRQPGAILRRTVPVHRERFQFQVDLVADVHRHGARSDRVGAGTAVPRVGGSGLVLAGAAGYGHRVISVTVGDHRGTADPLDLVLDQPGRGVAGGVGVGRARGHDVDA